MNSKGSENFLFLIAGIKTYVLKNEKLFNEAEKNLRFKKQEIYKLDAKVLTCYNLFAERRKHMKYLAYGSNINLEQMDFRCPYSTVYKTGVLKGWKLVFNYHADIIYTGKENDYVPVLLWDIDDYDWSFLDRYEGYPKYYTKEIVIAEADDGEKVPAIAYVMVENRKGIYPPSDDYFKGIIKGYKENKLKPINYLYNARYHAMHNQSKTNQYNPL